MAEIDLAVSMLAAKIGELLQTGKRCILAIDGRCAAGKTTLAAHLQTMFHCSVIHMDHFFLRPEQRTPARLEQPGGNIDYERFAQEIIPPLQSGTDFSYRPYLCHTQTFGDPIFIRHTPLMIVEGSYACHPALAVPYDLKVFLTVDSAQQLRRIEARNGKSRLSQFAQRWIPLEEQYFKTFQIAEASNFCF